jgi:hypothetical protein
VERGGNKHEAQREDRHEGDVQSRGAGADGARAEWPRRGAE